LGDLSSIDPDPSRSSRRTRGSRRQTGAPHDLGPRFRGDERRGGEGGADNGHITIAVPVLPRIANFDDLDPLRAEPGVRVVMVGPGQAIPGDAALVLIPGSKATIADLAFL